MSLNCHQTLAFITVHRHISVVLRHRNTDARSCAQAQRSQATSELTMTELSIQHVSTIDPDHVPEILCSGHFNIHVSGNMATLTFTHWRPKTGPLFSERKVELEAVIRAR